MRRLSHRGSLKARTARLISNAVGDNEPLPADPMNWWRSHTMNQSMVNVARIAARRAWTGIHDARPGERLSSPKKGTHMSPVILVLLVLIILLAVGGGVFVHNLLWLLLVLAVVVLLWNLMTGRRVA